MGLSDSRSRPLLRQTAVSPREPSARAGHRNVVARGARTGPGTLVLGSTGLSTLALLTYTIVQVRRMDTAKEISDTLP